MSVSYMVNGTPVTREEFEKRSARRVRLHGGVKGMLDSRQAPRADTDTDFFKNFGTLEKEHGPVIAGMLTSMAAKEGYRASPNDVYDPSIAQYPGDPRAFVKSRGELVKRAEELGVRYEINGRVVAKYREPERDPWEQNKQLAPDIAMREAAKQRKLNPKLSLPEAIEMVTDKHGS